MASTPINPDWRNTAFIPVKTVAAILGVSHASIYALEQKKILTFRRIAGRTVVVTSGVIALVNSDEPWTPSKVGAAARASRKERVRKNWQSDE